MNQSDIALQKLHDSIFEILKDRPDALARTREVLDKTISILEGRVNVVSAGREDEIYDW